MENSGKGNIIAKFVVTLHKLDTFIDRQEAQMILNHLVEFHGIYK